MTSEFLTTPLISLSNRQILGKSENKMWKKMKLVQTHKLSSHPNYLIYNAKRNAYFFGNDNNLLNYNLKTSKISLSWTKEESIIKTFKLRKDGLLAAYSTLSGEAKILSLSHKSVLKSFKLSQQPVCSLDLLNFKPLLAIGGDNGSFEVKDFASEITLASYSNLHSDFLRKCLFFENSEHVLLTGGHDRKICLVDIREDNNVINETYLPAEITDMVCTSQNHFISLSAKEVRLWDIKNMSEPVFVSSMGTKSLSCAKFFGDKLFLSSFDGNIRITKINNDSLEIVNQKNFKQPITNFDLAIDNNSLLKSIAISTIDGNVRILNRSKDSSLISDQGLLAQGDQLSPEEQNLYKLLATGVGPKEINAFQYFNRGVWGVPEQFSVKVEKTKMFKNSVQEKHLRKFQFDLALIAALKTDDSTVIVSLLEELIIRNCLVHAIKLLEQTHLKSLGFFLLKKCDSANCQTIIVHVLDVFFQCVADQLLKHDFLDAWIFKLANKLDNELQNSERCAFIQSYCD